MNYSVKPNYSVKIENSFSFKPNSKNRYSYSVKRNRNTILKYSVSFIPNRIMDLIIPIPIRFLITPIRLNTNYDHYKKIIYLSTVIINYLLIAFDRIALGYYTVCLPYWDSLILLSFCNIMPMMVVVVVVVNDMLYQDARWCCYITMITTIHYILHTSHVQ